MIKSIAFDADDTLWHNEEHYAETQRRFKALLARYHSPEWIDKTLLETEKRNLKHFGYGPKGFTLSMIETAIELTEGRISASEVMSILDMGKEMVQVPTELLPHVNEVVPALAQEYPLLLITKGDLLVQETKFAKSGLTDYFTHVEIVSEKTPAVYQSILDRYSITATDFMMIGNSMRSDILPVLEVGGYGVHIPYRITWEHERVAEAPSQTDRFFELDSLDRLPDLVSRLT